MLYRVRQFIQGLHATITEEDFLFIQKHLNSAEQYLFFQLRIGEQKHSVNVAYGCMSQVPEDRVLIKAALLHDIGKIGSNLTLLNKALVVLAMKFKIKETLLPPFLKEALRYKLAHPELGYRILLPLDMDEKVLHLIRYHHEPNKNQYNRMAILQHYDNMY